MALLNIDFKQLRTGVTVIKYLSSSRTQKVNAGKYRSLPLLV